MDTCHYAVISACSKNSLRHCCCKSIVHCNRKRDRVDLLAKLRLPPKLHQALQLGKLIVGL